MDLKNNVVKHLDQIQDLDNGKIWKDIKRVNKWQYMMIIVNIKDNGQIIKEMVTAKLFMLTKMFMKAFI